MPSNQVLINPELQRLEQGSAWVELYTLDATAFGGPIQHFCNHLDLSGNNVVFGSTTYQAIPIQVAGWDTNQTGTAPKPTISIGNLNKVLLSSIISYGDLVGAKLTRVRTFSKFLADGSNPNGSAFIGPDVMYVEQKTLQSKALLQFQLTSIVERMGMKLPRRQILKDTNHLGCAFPGVARNRVA